METAAHVRKYYLKHFERLPIDKQFHFASRLASWHGDETCQQQLQRLRPYFVGADNAVAEDLRQLITEPPAAKINAARSRTPYFKRYPMLRGLMLALFRVRHLYYLYGVDVRPALLKLVSLTELYELSDNLQKDPEAVRVLSTYAINYMYLVERILYPRSPIKLDPVAFYPLADGYDTGDPEQMLLLMYLYTHCIIGETNFYQRPIDRQYQQLYNSMLQRIDRLLSQHFSLVNLDNKLEFLVCCRICDFDTGLKARIYAECEQSISPEGDFLIDTLNDHKQSKKTSFTDSEHRNVLFIMSTLPFRPKA